MEYSGIYTFSILDSLWNIMNIFIKAPVYMMVSKGNHPKSA